MKISDAGKTAVSFHGSGIVLVRGWPDWQPKHLLTHKQPALSVDVSSDGRRVLTTSRDLVVRCWDAESGQLLSIDPWHTDRLISARLTPSGDRLLSTSVDRSVHVVATETRVADVSLQLDVTSGQPTFLSLADDATLLMVGMHKGGTITILDPTSGETIRDIETPFKKLLRGAQLRPGTKTLAAVGMPSDGSLHLWDASNGEEQEPIRCGSRGPSCLAFSPNGDFVALGVPSPLNSDSEIGETQVWDLNSRRKVAKLDPLDAQDMWIRFSPDGRFLVGMSWNHVKVWDVKNWKLVRSWNEAVQGLSRDMAISFDGAMIAVSNPSSHEVQLLDVETGGQSKLGARGELVSAIEFVPSGHRLLTGSSYGVLRIWDPAISESLVTIQSDTKRISDILVPSRVNSIMTAGSGQLRI